MYSLLIFPMTISPSTDSSDTIRGRISSSSAPCFRISTEVMQFTAVSAIS